MMNSCGGIKRRALRLFPLFVLLLTSVDGVLVAQQCVPRVWDHDRKASMMDDTGHRRGRLSAEATARYYCTCDESCRSDCAPYFRSTSCVESGRLSSEKHYHRVYQKKRKQSGSKIARGSSASGADCGTGFGCFGRECLIGTGCGTLGYTVSASPLDIGVSVKIVPTRDVIHDLVIDQPFQCEGCPTVQETAALASRHDTRIGDLVDQEETPDQQLDIIFQYCDTTCTGTTCTGGVCWEECWTTCSYS